MKKQFFLSGIILIAGLFFSTLNNNSLKACCKNAPGGAVIKRNNVYKMPVNEVYGADESQNMFMNPFQQL